MSDTYISTLSEPRFTIESFESLKTGKAEPAWWKAADPNDAIELSTVTATNGKVKADRRALKVDYRINNWAVFGTNKNFDNWEGFDLSAAESLKLWVYPTGQNVSLKIIFERNQGEQVELDVRNTSELNNWTQLTWDLKNLSAQQRALLKNVNNIIFKIVNKGSGTVYLDQVQVQAAAKPHNVNTGIFVGDEPAQLASIHAFQAKPKISTAILFTPWTTDSQPNGPANPLPIEKARELLSKGITPILTWEPNNIPLNYITDKRYDRYIEEFIASVKQLKTEFPNSQIALRWGHEMNAGRFSWCGKPELYKKAYQYVFDKFEAAGANDFVTWMWTVNEDNDDGIKNFDQYYPGDKYVEVIGLDGYNWGESRVSNDPYRKWRFFDEIFSLAYNKLSKYNKPISLVELSSHIEGGSRANWIADALSQTASPFYPLITNINWFNAKELQARDADLIWEINGYPAEMQNYQALLSNPNFIYSSPAFPSSAAAAGKCMKIVPQGIYQGAYTPRQDPNDPQNRELTDVKSIADFEKMSGQKLDIVTLFASNNFQESYFDKIREVGNYQAQRGGALFVKSEIFDGPFTLHRVLEGKQDYYLKKLAAAIKDIKGPVFLSFGHEMNADWYPWGCTKNFKTCYPEEYKKAFRYVHALFEKEGVANITWVWNPANEKNPLAYYPGHEYVDWVAVDGYNNTGWNEWSSFEKLFDKSIRVLHLLGKPIMIGEFASDEKDPIEAAQKPGFLSDSIEYMAKGAPVQAFVYFNVNKTDEPGNPANRWMISSPQAQEAYRAALGKHAPLFKEGIQTAACDQIKATAPLSDKEIEELGKFEGDLNNLLDATRKHYLKFKSTGFTDQTGTIEWQNTLQGEYPLTLGPLTFIPNLALQANSASQINVFSLYPGARLMLNFTPTQNLTLEAAGRAYKGVAPAQGNLKYFHQPALKAGAFYWSDYLIAGGGAELNFGSDQALNGYWGKLLFRLPSEIKAGVEYSRYPFIYQTNLITRDDWKLSLSKSFALSEKASVELNLNWPYLQYEKPTILFSPAFLGLKGEFKYKFDDVNLSAFGSFCNQQNYRYGLFGLGLEL